MDQTVLVWKHHKSADPAHTGWWWAVGSRWKDKERPKWSQPPPQIYASSPTSLLFCTSPFCVFFTWQKSEKKQEHFWKREGTKSRRGQWTKVFLLFHLVEWKSFLCVSATRWCLYSFKLLFILFLISTYVTLCFVWRHQRGREKSYVCRWKPDWAQRAAERRTLQQQLPSTKSHLQDNKSTQTAVSDTSDTLQWRHEVITATKWSSSCCGQRKPHSVLPSHTADEETADVVTVGCDAAGGTETERTHGRCRL